MKIAILTPYSAQGCPLTSYSQNLIESLKTISPEKLDLIGVVNENNGTNPALSFTIRKNNIHDYLNASQFINQHYDLVIVQHHFEAFGGEDGRFMVILLQSITIPIFTTLHQLTSNPTPLQKQIVLHINKISNSVVVLSNQSAEIAEHTFKIQHDKLWLTDYPVAWSEKSASREQLKKNLGYDGKTILGGFGFLSSQKGFENIVAALPFLIGRHPDLIFIHMGLTNPNNTCKQNDLTRYQLRWQACHLGVGNNVIFIEQSASLNEVMEFMNACDIFIAPYSEDSNNQSGTLIQALACGAAIYATPFWHAKELLSDGRGELVPFDMPDLFAEQLSMLINDQSKLNQYREAASDAGKIYRPEKLGLKYLAQIETILTQAKKQTPNPTIIQLPLLPPASFNAIEQHTDHVGLVNYNTQGVAHQQAGYQLSGNALALVSSLLFYQEFPNDKHQKHATLFLGFIKMLQQSNGSFYGSLSPNHQFIEDGSNNQIAIAIWALGNAVKLAPNKAFEQLAKNVFFNALPHVNNITNTRLQAFALIGLSEYLTINSGDEYLFNHQKKLAKQLVASYQKNSFDQWNWYTIGFESDLAIIPLALLHANSVQNDRQISETIRKSIHFIEQHYFSSYFGTMPLKESRLSRKNDADQLAIEVMWYILLMNKLYNQNKEIQWLEKMNRAINWFFGENNLRKPLINLDGNCGRGISGNKTILLENSQSAIAYAISLITTTVTSCSELMDEA